jgi:hypothetical protein
MNSNIATTLNLAQAGLYLTPCNQVTKAPLLPSWQTRATNSPNGVRYYWEKYGSNSMPGIVCGLSDLIVIDVDCKSGVDGRAAFDPLLDQHGDLPRCPVTITPSGGFHFYLKQPGGRPQLRNCTGALPRGIDVRGAGGQVIAPGSVRSDGTFYESAPGWPDLAESFMAGTIPEIPEWLVAIIEAKPATSGGVPLGGDRPRAAASGDKSKWAAAGLDAEATALAATTEPGRNDALYKMACTFAGHAANGWVTREQVHAAAEWACMQNGYLASGKPNDGPQQFRKTFESGWRWGYARPTSGPREPTIDPQMFAGLKPRAA